MSPQANVLPQEAQALKQCQNCLKAETDENRLLTCSGCKLVYYCDAECQMANWKSHKPICNINRETKERMKADSSAPSPGGSVDAVSAESTVEKWIQCQNCLRLGTDDKRLLSCSKCKRAHYCDRDCQMANWKSHKPICNLNRQTKERLKADSSSPSPLEGSVNVASTETTLKKWVQLHRPLLSVTAMHALQLKTNPDRLLTHMLVIDLTPSPSYVANPKSTAKDAFHVVSTAIVPLPDMTDIGPGNDFAVAIGSTLEQSRQVRANGSALGYAVVMTKVSSTGVAHLTPLGIEGIPPEVTWNKDWEATLREHVRRGDDISTMR